MPFKIIELSRTYIELLQLKCYGSDVVCTGLLNDFDDPNLQKSNCSEDVTGSDLLNKVEKYEEQNCYILARKGC